MLELARPSDWEAVQKLSVQIHELHVAWRPDIYFSTQEPLPKEAFLAGIANRTVYVAKIDGTVVGYVVLRLENRGGPGTHAHKAIRVESICVEESLRGHGIGKEMIADMRALGKAFGCREILLSVHPENDEAVGFYQKCGLQIRTIGMDMKI